MNVIRTDAEISELECECVEYANFGTKFRGMSYEDGIIAVLQWLVEADKVGPMDD